MSAKRGHKFQRSARLRKQVNRWCPSSAHQYEIDIKVLAFVRASVIRHAPERDVTHPQPPRGGEHGGTGLGADAIAPRLAHDLLCRIGSQVRDENNLNAGTIELIGSSVCAA